MTLIESLAFETPVVSFDCPCGPSEIIEDDINGRLIKNQDFNELAMVLRELCHSEDRLKFYKENALQSIEKFTTEKVINNWLHLINT
jgi:N-acetylgalactosamine-N,N'-diacetylbacillosaminyl-diphospho-undecaprenol 4-alpha-N-acetylgalactosaminyltransferase